MNQNEEKITNMNILYTFIIMLMKIIYYLAKTRDDQIRNRKTNRK